MNKMEIADVGDLLVKKDVESQSDSLMEMSEQGEASSIELLGIKPEKVDIGADACRNIVSSPEHPETRSDLFTSEIFKIEIQNLPKHYGYKV